jgi:hypothetical protein
MIEIADTDGDPPSNLTSPQIPHMNWAETSFVSTKWNVRAVKISTALTLTENNAPALRLFPGH